MYDTVNFWLNRVEAKGNFEASTLCLTNSRETVNVETGDVWVAGNLDNLKISLSMTGLSVKGSLAKFYLPDNSYTLNRNQVKEAICKLSDTLHLDLMDAGITRVDVAANFIMQHRVAEYYNVLGLCTHFNRVQATNNTLYYQSKGKEQKRTLSFYDKSSEVAARGGVMPDVYAGTNLLRYESRWNTRLPQQFKEVEVKGRTLCEDRFYNKALSYWADSYFKIDKKRSINIDAMNEIKTVSEAKDLICAIALQRLPVDEVQSILEDLKQRKVFDNRTNYTRLKNKLKEISSMAKTTDTDLLVRELDGEVKNILAYKR